MKKLLILAAVIASAGSALAQDAMTVVTPDGLTWEDSPVMPKDGQVAVLLGDPTKAEVVVLRVKMPANYQVPPPTHPYAETITVNPPVRISAAVSSIFVAGFFSGR